MSFVISEWELQELQDSQSGKTHGGWVRERAWKALQLPQCGLKRNVCIPVCFCGKHCSVFVSWNRSLGVPVLTEESYWRKNLNAAKQLHGEGGSLQLLQHQIQSFLQGNGSVPIVSHINIFNNVEKTQRNVSVLVLAGMELIISLLAGIVSGI